eukprot:scaffold7039_cov255-Pinguiococcus_pyrenoidosus.AAC.9
MAVWLTQALALDLQNNASLLVLLWPRVILQYHANRVIENTCGAAVVRTAAVETERARDVPLSPSWVSAEHSRYPAAWSSCAAAAPSCDHG